MENPPFNLNNPVAKKTSYVSLLTLTNVCSFPESLYNVFVYISKNEKKKTSNFNKNEGGW